jgi:hypothetical protein
MNLVINVTAPLENAGERERAAFDRKVSARLSREMEFEGDTTDDTELQLWSYELPPDSTATALATITGVTASAAKVYSMVHRFVYRRVGTAAAEIMAAEVIGTGFSSDGGWDTALALGTADGEISIVVDGDPGDTVHWFGSVRLWVNKL